MKIKVSSTMAEQYWFVFVLLATICTTRRMGVHSARLSPQEIPALPEPTLGKALTWPQAPSNTPAIPRISPPPPLTFPWNTPSPPNPVTPWNPWNTQFPPPSPVSTSLPSPISNTLPSPISITPWITQSPPPSPVSITLAPPSIVTPWNPWNTISPPPPIPPPPPPLTILSPPFSWTQPWQSPPPPVDSTTPPTPWSKAPSPPSPVWTTPRFTPPPPLDTTPDSPPPPWNRPWLIPASPPPPPPMDTTLGSPPPPWNRPWLIASSPPPPPSTSSPPPPWVHPWFASPPPLPPPERVYPWTPSPPPPVGPIFPWTPSPPPPVGPIFPWTPSPPPPVGPIFPWTPSPPPPVGPIFPWTPSPPGKWPWITPSPPPKFGLPLPSFTIPPGLPFIPSGIQFTFSNFTQSWLPQAGMKVQWESLITVEVSLQLLLDAVVKPILLIIQQFDSLGKGPGKWGWTNALQDSKLASRVGAACTMSNKDGFPERGMMIVKIPIDNTTSNAITWFTVLFDGWTQTTPFNATLDTTPGTFGAFVTNSTLPDLNTFCSHPSSLARRAARQGLHYTMN